MTAAFRYELPDLQRAGARLADNASRLTEAVDQLAARAEGAGSPWGGDEFGTVFAVAYTAVTTQALDRFGALAARLGELGDAFQTMAANLGDADDDSTARLDNA